MTDLIIDDVAFSRLRHKVIIITGGSSGIGLATVQLLLASGSKVVIGDRNPPPPELLDDGNVTYLQIDVTNWRDLVALFKKAREIYGSIDHVFANAGISSKTSFFDDETDENGDPVEPNYPTLDVNLTSVVNTVKLAIFYLKQQKGGGSIVLTASASSFQRFSSVDYTTAKHGVLGLMRGLTPHLYPKLPIRINAIAPSWTDTGIVPRSLFELVGVTVQSTHVVALSVALLMSSDGGNSVDIVDSSRHGQLIYSVAGLYREIEEGMLEAVAGLLSPLSLDGLSENEALERVLVAVRAMKLEKDGVSN
ncbi:hypothetical protein PAAG_06938 [Paracoccidioides lutzii Pb01]|uniref:Uncharacterized protein n=1 Tax=Paracoccidioides lutzii (strain ATCC MYA-826 / Pb01) TaxID=502779 RepID=C1H8E2_PARBA|nr:hypothetical protein PAAG_06938 [Paracoccidioides lutzii Pb01]EEH36520.2 hypothetical protein PAAG_06938 [Paracoccidioides lutzii Pb01]